MRAYRLPLRTGLVVVVLLAVSAFAAAAEIEPGLPANTTAVLTVNLKQLLHAPLLKRHGLASLRQLCRNTDSVRTILEAMGFDPFRDLDRLTVASVGLGEKAEGVVILRGRFDTARFHLAAKMLVKEHSDRLVMHKDEKLKYISVVSTGGHGSIIFGAGANAKKGAVLNVRTKGCLLDAFGDDCIALLDKTTLVAATSEKLLKETCQRIADKDLWSTSKLNKPMHRLLADLDGKQTILFAMRQAQPTIDKSPLAASREYYGRELEKAAASRGVTLEEMWEEQWKTPMPFPTIKQCDTDESGCWLKSDSQTVPSLFPASFLPPPPVPEPPSSEAKEEPSKPSWELSGSIRLADDFMLRCAVRTTNAADARVVMKGFEELRLRADGLMTFLAGSSKEYAFLKDIPRSFLAVRKGRILLVEGRLPPETLDKLLETCSVNSR
ncbi:MAG: hypothetical protein ACRELG_17200 [Gemmataceae bacterium]